MILVRAATDADTQAAIRVVRRSITTLCASDPAISPPTRERWLANKTPDNFRAWLRNPANHCVVGELDGRPVGVGLLHEDGEIMLLYVDPDAQRRGAGRAIHAALEAHARGQGLARLHLCSTAQACPFYVALGYEVAGPARHLFGTLWCVPHRKPLGASPPHPSGRTRDER